MKRPDPDLVPVSQSHVRQIDAYRAQHPEAGHNAAWHATLLNGLSGAVLMPVREPVTVRVECEEKTVVLKPE